jgi:hypothetical protein
VLRALSKGTYQLEHLDLTGCSAWFRALTKKRDVVQFGGADDVEPALAQGVDWAGDWGKITTLVMRSGYETTKEANEARGAVSRGSIVGVSDSARRAVSVMAWSTEKHITAQRAGKGRFITVVRDNPDAWGQ